MKKCLLSSLALALVASAFGGGEGVLVGGEARTSRLSAASLAPTLASQYSDIQLPAPLTPTPDPAYSNSAQPLNSYPTSPFPGMSSPSYGVAQPLPLFADVRYRGVRNVSPCAVPTIIQVPDPCNKDKCCKTCVNVEVCAPPCDPQKIKVTRDGNRVRYDYGRYAVVVRTVGDHVVVHYHD